VEFLDWLASARQQRLAGAAARTEPIAGIRRINRRRRSPGNPYLISLDLLAADGLLDSAELQQAQTPANASYPAESISTKSDGANLPLLSKAARQLAASRGHLTAEFEDFCKSQASWLDSFAAFMSLRTANSDKVWCEWTNLVDAHYHKLSDADEFQKLEPLYRALQFLFFRQWNRLRREAHRRGILLVGDVPIYVSYDSADVWSQPRVFSTQRSRPADKRRRRARPIIFSATGQLWNNPLYDWDALQRDGYCWWIQRLRTTLELVDMVRLDHFRGFEAYWSVPAGETTAVNGEWFPVPVRNFCRRWPINWRRRLLRLN